MGDKIGVLNEGRLVQVGTPNEIYNAPRDTFVAGFVGSPAMNLMRRRGRGRDGSACRGRSSCRSTARGRARLGRDGRGR